MKTQMKHQFMKMLQMKETLKIQILITFLKVGEEYIKEEKRNNN